MAKRSRRRRRRSKQLVRNKKLLRSKKLRRSKKSGRKIHFKKRTRRKHMGGMNTCIRRLLKPNGSDYDLEHRMKDKDSDLVEVLGTNTGDPDFYKKACLEHPIQKPGCQWMDCLQKTDTDNGKTIEGLCSNEWKMAGYDWKFKRDKSGNMELCEWEKAPKGTAANPDASHEVTPPHQSNLLSYG